MTNTRISDPEIFERRYPVILREFSIRAGSGGKGMHDGGNGVVRDIEVTEPLQCSILSERRVYRPYGLEGGGDAQCGLNIWKKLPREKDGDLVEGRDPKSYRSINVGAKSTMFLGKGDRFVINTPGGGAWGKVEDKDKSPLKEIRAKQGVNGVHHRGSQRGTVADRNAEAEGSA